MKKKELLNILNNLKETSRKINIVFVRASPIMETLNWYNDCIINFYFCKISYEQ